MFVLEGIDLVLSMSYMVSYASVGTRADHSV